MAAYDLDTAKQKVVDYTTPKYGRGPNSDAEWQQIAQGINYSDGVDDNELQQAYGNADRYAASIGAQPNQGAQPPSPQGPVSPQYSVPVPQNLQSTVGNLFQQQPASPIQSAYQDALLPLIQQAQQPVSITDPQLQPSSETAPRGSGRRSGRGMLSRNAWAPKARRAASMRACSNSITAKARTSRASTPISSRARWTRAVSS